LIWVEAVIDGGDASSQGGASGKRRLEYVVRVKSNYKQRSIGNNIEISIPVRSDVDSPSFKPGIGGINDDI
jgi:AP-1 complex subunit mu